LGANIRGEYNSHLHRRNPPARVQESAKADFVYIEAVSTAPSTILVRWPAPLGRIEFTSTQTKPACAGSRVREGGLCLYRSGFNRPLNHPREVAGTFGANIIRIYTDETRLRGLRKLIEKLTGFY
jgi:hypothetical protein